MKTLLNFLRRKLSTVALAALTLILAGCGPKEAVVWSPDGRYAVVSADEGLLVDATGARLGVAFNAHEELRAWLPDSQHVLIVRHVPAQDWAEYAPLLGSERVQSIVRAADEAAGLIAAYRGDWRTFGTSPAVKTWTENLEARGEEVLNVAFYLQQTQPQVLAPLIEAERQMRAEEKAREATGAPAPEGQDTLFREDDLVAQIAELRVRQAVPPNPAADRLLVRSADSILWAAPSPGGKTIAFVRSEPSFNRLYVLYPETGASPVLVDEGTDFAAWSPDGQDLAYAKVTVPRPQQQANMQLASITRRRVCTPSGEILATMESSEDLAGLILPGRSARLAWLPDGRILFASGAFTLPATTEDLPKDFTLFALRLQPSPKIERLIPASVQPLLPDRADLFTVSPDAKKVALLGRNGKVAVFFLETGALVPLQADLPQLRESSTPDVVIPAWRNADELSYLVGAGDPAGSPHRGEVVLGSLSGAKRAISKSWPDADFLPPLKE